MEEDAVKSSRILLVDDEEPNLRLLERTLARAGYQNITSTAAAADTLTLYFRVQPDLLVLDLMMPEMDGFAVMRELAPHIPPDGYFPILVLTGDTTVETRRRALALGANDFVTKPFDSFEVRLRIWNLLHTRRLYLDVQGERQELEHRVAERTRELELAQQEILERLALASEYKDDETGAHVRRVSRLATRLARELGLREDEADLIGRAALLHDVGKIATPDAIQLKKGPLNRSERDVIERHARLGAAMLAGSRFQLLRLAEDIARSHHEHWDGTGYPDRVAGEAIPLAGRIVAVADAFDALTHARPYKDAWPADEALAEIEAGRGSRYDPRIVDALHRIGPTETQS